MSNRKRERGYYFKGGKSKDPFYTTFSFPLQRYNITHPFAFNLSTLFSPTSLPSLSTIDSLQKSATPRFASPLPPACSRLYPTAVLFCAKSPQKCLQNKCVDYGKSIVSGGREGGLWSSDRRRIEGDRGRRKRKEGCQFHRGKEIEKESLEEKSLEWVFNGSSFAKGVCT